MVYDLAIKSEEIGMIIKKALESDIDAIEAIYAEARAFMRKSGNLLQWQGGYPGREVIASDIKSESLYKVCEDDSDLPIAVFFFNIGIDPTYLKIYGGEWLCPEREYGVIHRIAIAESAHGKGVGRFCFDFCYSIIQNLRIDTHKDNLPMRRSLAKAGFSERGIIYLASGDERIAFQKTGE